MDIPVRQHIRQEFTSAKGDRVRQKYVLDYVFHNLGNVDAYIGDQRLPLEAGGPPLSLGNPNTAGDVDDIIKFEKNNLPNPPEHKVLVIMNVLRVSGAENDPDTCTT